MAPAERWAKLRRWLHVLLLLALRNDAQHTFRYESPGSFQAAYEVSLRASIDEWCVDVPMPKLGSTDSEEPTFELRRMVPREAVEYTFTIVPCQHPTPITTHATDRPSRRSLSDNAVRPVRGSTALAGERPIVNWVEKTKKPAAGRWSDVINAPDAVLPRSSDFIPASRKTAWSLPISVFAGCVLDVGCLGVCLLRACVCVCVCVRGAQVPPDAWLVMAATSLFPMPPFSSVVT